MPQDKESKTLDLNILKAPHRPTNLNLSQMKSNSVERKHDNAESEVIRKKQALRVQEHTSVNDPKIIDKINSRKNGTQAKTRSIFMPVFIFIAIVSFFLFFTQFIQADSFYSGKWKANVTDEEKRNGINSIEFELSSGRLLQKIEAEISGTKITAELNSLISTFSSNSTEVTFRQGLQEITSLEIEMPEEQCNEDIKKCELNRENLKKQFRDKTEEQNKKIAAENIRITKKSNNEIVFDSRTDGKRLLEKI